MGGGDRAGGGGPRDHRPKEQLDRDAGLYTADRESGRRGEGRPFLSAAFLLFLRQREETGAGVAAAGPGGRGGGGGAGGTVSWGGRRGRGGDAEKQESEGPVAVSWCFEKQSRINPRDCHSSVSELFSPGKDTLALSHKWETCNVMKIHRGREDRRGRPPHACPRGAGAPSRGPAVVEKRHVASCRATPSRPRVPTPQTRNQSERTGRQMNKSRSGVQPWERYFGSDENILDFDVLCLLFGFPLEQRCVRRPWLASWQGS